MSNKIQFNAKKGNMLQVIGMFLFIAAISFGSMGGCSSNNRVGDSFP